MGGPRGVLVAGGGAGRGGVLGGPPGLPRPPPRPPWAAIGPSSALSAAVGRLSPQPIAAEREGPPPGFDPRPASILTL